MKKTIKLWALVDPKTRVIWAHRIFEKKVKNGGVGSVRELNRRRRGK